MKFCIIKTCTVCGTIYPKSQTRSIASWEQSKTCSRECYYKSLVGKPSPAKKSRAKVCEHCHKEYELHKRGKNWAAQKYCSNKCQGLAKLGENGSFYGHKHTEEAKQNNAKAHIGKEAWNKGLTGPDAPGWKGGEKASRVRHKAKRRALGFIPINECLDKSWVGHHMDYEHVMYIPEALHISIQHSVLRNRNMEKINAKVQEWYNTEYLKSC